MKHLVVTKLDLCEAEGTIDGRPFKFRASADHGDWTCEIGGIYERWHHHAGPTWTLDDVRRFIDAAASGFRDYQVWLRDYQERRRP